MSAPQDSSDVHSLQTTESPAALSQAEAESITSESAIAIAQLAKLWRHHERVVVFTGAGMSTESGLQDFRSAGGLWKQQRRFEELASVTALTHHPKEFDEFYRWRIEQVQRFQPHRGHYVLSDLEQRGLIQCVITQNVDGYHEQAGSQNVLCLHGSLLRSRCQRCGAKSTPEDFLKEDGARCKVTHKSLCGGKVRPEVVLFGESLDSAILERAVDFATQADLFVVLGSSLLVSPASTLPQIALRAGATLAIVNQDPTPFTSRAEVSITQAIGPTLEALSRTLATSEFPPPNAE